MTTVRLPTRPSELRGPILIELRENRVKKGRESPKDHAHAETDAQRRDR